MPFANQGDDCEMRGSWHQSPMISGFRDRAYKTPVYSTNSFPHFHTSVYYHESPAAPPPSAFSQYYGAHYDSKIGILPETPSHNPFRHSQLRGLRTRNVSERQIIEAPIARPRLGSVRREYDIDDVFCPSYVDRDAAKMRSQLNNVSNSISATSPTGGDSTNSILKSAPEKCNGQETAQEASPLQHINSELSDSNISCDSSIKTDNFDGDSSKIAHYSTSVDSEAERALLLSMGWQEATEEELDSDISQQEIEEFYRLLRNSSATQQGRLSGRIRHTSDQTSSTPGLSTGSTPAQPEVFDDKCLSDDGGLSSDDSLSINEDD